MVNKRAFAALVIGLAFVYGLCAFVFARNRVPLSGECLALSQLPWFGAELPTENLGQIRYVAEKKYRRVFARVSVTTQEFEKVAAELKLSVMRYQMGFHDADFANVDRGFRPGGTEVSFAYGSISKDGRATVRLFFEPASAGNTNGVLYVHIS
jgi:hypothetical protein